MQITTQINDLPHIFEKQLICAQTIYDKVNIIDEKLLLVLGEGSFIEIKNTDYLILRDNDIFITDSNVSNSTFNPIEICFNGRFGRDYQLQTPKITGRDLKKLDTEFPDGRLFVSLELEDETDIEVSDDMVIIVREGLSVIVIPPVDDNNKGDPIDIESCSRHNRRPPRGHHYRIRIDREKFIVDKAIISGKEILSTANKDITEWALNQKFLGGKRLRIEGNEVVDLTRCGVERFETVRRQAQQGNTDPFDITAEDREYLDANHPNWTKKCEGQGKFGLVIGNFIVPQGYDKRMTNLMILIPSGYPAAPLDMFYLDPPLTKQNGQLPNSLASEQHFGTNWQRWSRHYEWRVGEDSIVRHIEFIISQLTIEGV